MAVSLLVAVGDPALGKVVRREFNVDAVAHQDADTVAAHAARDGREHNVVAVIDLNLEISVRLFIYYYAR